MSPAINGLAFNAFCVAVTAVALVALAAILWTLVGKGIGGGNIDVFTMSTPAPGSRGGLANAIMGSTMMCALAMVMAGTFGALAGPWLAEYSLTRTKDPIYEFACHEGNYSLPNILRGARAQEQGR